MTIILFKSQSNENVMNMSLLAVRGPWLLSIVADLSKRPQLKLISLGLAHRLSYDNYEHDEDGEENQNTADCYSHHCTVTH